MKKETYNKLFDEKFNEIEEMSKEVDYKNLIYNFTTKASGDGDISLKTAEKDQEIFKKDLGQIKSGNPKHKSGKQLYTIKNAKNLYDSRLKWLMIDWFNDYWKIRSESIYRSKHDKTKGTRLKMLTPKQMIQRLPIALAQVKAGNNSESLLHEIRQIVYSLYQLKQITKKVYNNIIESIQI